MLGPVGPGARRLQQGVTNRADSSAVPSRRRRKSPTPEVQDPVARFAAGLRESAAREQADRDRRQLERRQARDAAQAAAEHAAALEDARRELERAIDQARHARRAGSGVAASDAAWRAAKARVVELETGAPPAWARRDEAEVRDVAGDDGDPS